MGWAGLVNWAGPSPNELDWTRPNQDLGWSRPNKSFFSSFLFWAGPDPIQSSLHEQWTWIIIHARYSCMNSKMWIIYNSRLVHVVNKGKKKKNGKGKGSLPGSGVTTVITGLAKDGGKAGGSQRSWRQEKEKEEEACRGERWCNHHVRWLGGCLWWKWWCIRLWWEWRWAKATVEREKW